MLVFIITLLLYTLFCSLFICGFYKLSRSQVIVMPDGSTRTDGYILKWWSEFWEQTKGVKAWQYSGDQLEEKYRVLLAANSKLAARLLINPERMSFQLKDSNILSDADRKFIEDYLQVRVLINAGSVFLFLDEPKYRFPKSVRFMWSQCHVCMASPLSFGLISYIGFVKMNTGMAENWVLLALFIPFCVVLSFLNYIIGRKFDL